MNRLNESVSFVKIIRGVHFCDCCIDAGLPLCNKCSPLQRKYIIREKREQKKELLPYIMQGQIFGGERSHVILLGEVKV